MNEKFDLFTVKLGIYTNENKNLHGRMLEKVKAYQNEEGRHLSNMGGFQSKDLPIEGAFKEFVDTTLFSRFKEYLKEDYCFEPVEVILDNVWANINYQYSSNIMHEHPGADFSFVYYLQTPENSGDLVFNNPSLTMSYSDFFNRAWKSKTTPANCLSCNLSPTSGSLVFFPAYLRHYVEPNNNHSPRISIAGNLKVGFHE